MALVGWRRRGVGVTEGAAAGRTILTLNAGSSSLKLGLFAASGEEQLAEARVGWEPDQTDGHATPLRQLLAGVDLEAVAAVGHRVVHGGARFTDAVLIDPDIREEIAALAGLAPLHNRPALDVVAATAAMLPGLPQVAVFDTAFHATLPPSAFLYALPYAWYERWGVRRFGFHGLSHAYAAGRAAELLGRAAADLKLVSCHLGGGCSLAAIAGGRSVATTMGFTPLDGVVMATRPGAVDPGVVTFLVGAGGMEVSDLEAALYHQSGLAGVSGLSGDMRELLAARAAGHGRAALAFDLYVARLREGIGAMAAALGGLDAVVFTGGVGEAASEVRAAACDRFEWLGLGLDEAANADAVPDAAIARPDSRVRVLVLRSREGLMIARETARLLGSGR